MRKEDLGPIWAYANTIWDTFKVPDTEEKVAMAIEVWVSLLKDYDLPLIKAGMLEHAKVSDFCNVVKIAEQCKNLMAVAQGTAYDENAIVNEIRRAIGNGTYGARDEFEKLSPIAKRVVGEPRSLYDWATYEGDGFDTVIMSNVRRAVRTQIESQRKLDLIKNQGLGYLLSESSKQSIGYTDDDGE